MEKQSRREFASADATAEAQDATLQERRFGAEIPLDPCRRVQHLQRPTPSGLRSNASHASRRGDEHMARSSRGSLKLSEAHFRHLSSGSFTRLHWFEHPLPLTIDVYAHIATHAQIVV